MADTAPLTTTLNRKWLVKMWIFTLFLLGLGVWGAIDAWVVYPARGERHTKFMLREYLDRLSREGSLLRSASVEDPAAELERLRAQPDLPVDSAEAARRQWLESLSRITNLARLRDQNRAERDRRATDPSRTIDTTTMFSDPVGRLDRLNQELAGSNVPSPLAAYDIPLQYLFVAIGFGGAVWLVYFLARCRRIVYRYDPAEHRLTLPSGKSFTPSEIAEVDKRDWHKYYMHMTLKDGTPEFRLDLLRHWPLEEWVLEMERLHPNYVPPPPEEEAPRHGGRSGDGAEGAVVTTLASGDDGGHGSGGDGDSGGGGSGGGSGSNGGSSD